MANTVWIDMKVVGKKKSIDTLLERMQQQNDKKIHFQYIYNVEIEEEGEQSEKGRNYAMISFESPNSPWVGLDLDIEYWNKQGDMKVTNLVQETMKLNVMAEIYADGDEGIYHALVYQGTMIDESANRNIPKKEYRQWWL